MHFNAPAVVVVSQVSPYPINFSSTLDHIELSSDDGSEEPQDRRRHMLLCFLKCDRGATAD